MGSIPKLPQEIVEDIVWWTRQMCCNDGFFCDLRLVNQQFNEAVLYALHFRPNPGATTYPLAHRKSCMTCSVTNIGFEFCNETYARMRLQSRLSQGNGFEKPEIRKWYDTLRAAINFLDNALAEPRQQSAQEALATDERYRSSSRFPAFANRTAFLLCDTVMNVLDMNDMDCLRNRSIHAPTTHIHCAPRSFWVILAAYNLGDLTFIRNLLQNTAFMEDIVGSKFGSLTLSLKLVARKGHMHVLQYLLDDELLDVRYDSSGVLRQACRAGQVESAKTMMSQCLMLEPEAASCVVLLHLDSERRQAGSGKPNWRDLMAYTGFMFPHGPSIPPGVRSWAEEVIKTLVEEQLWVPVVSPRETTDRISALFWSTVVSSFLLLHRSDDGSYSTTSCRKVVEDFLRTYNPDITKALDGIIETHMAKWPEPDLRLLSENDLKVLDQPALDLVRAAGCKNGLNILAWRNIKHEAIFLIVRRRRGCVAGHGLRTVGQYALYFALMKLQPENVEFLLRRDIRLPKSTSMKLVTWSYRRTHEEQYQAIQRILQGYYVRQIEIIL